MWSAFVTWIIVLEAIWNEIWGGGKTMEGATEEKVDYCWTSGRASGLFTLRVITLPPL